ncbi:hypothetical protein BVC80_9085g130 [Macleaya cordata]|uniref:Proton pump-interactor 1 n=1 Tax=Macleaya cordata TaxID=56857 RepID=A0A200PR68_MACCD|nr:hypothetical protein BVC80_9085g130 [Macleaya cordata]
MTVGTDDRTGVVAAEIECEGKSGGLNLNLREEKKKEEEKEEDPSNVVVGDDCNGVVHEIHGDNLDDEEDAKDDADGSYVFVDGADMVSDDPPSERGLDTEEEDPPRMVPDHTQGGEPIVEEQCVSELNAGGSLMAAEKHVQVDELSVVGKDSQFRPLHSEEETQSSSIVSSSRHDVTAEASECISNAFDEVVEQSDAVQEQNELHCSGVVEGNQESVVTGSEAAVSELQSPCDQEVTVEDENKLEAAENVEENSESHVVVTEAVESEPQGGEETAKAAVENSVEEPSEVNGEANHLGNGEANVGEKSNLEDADQNQESQSTSTVDLELELHQMDAEEEKVEEQSKLDLVTKLEEDQDTQNLGVESDESEVHQLVIGDEKETEKEATEEEPSGHVSTQRDLNLETAVCPVDESNLDQEARDVVEDQDTQILGAESVESELQQLVNADKKETEKEASEEENSGHVGTQRDLNLEMSISPEDDSLLEKEAKDAGEDQDTQILGTVSVESELDQLVNGGEKEMEKEIPVEEPSGKIGTQRDLNLETATCPLDDSQLDKEAKADVEEDQDTQILSTESLASEQHQLVNGGERDTENEAPVEQPSGHIATQRVLNSETAIWLADDSQLDKEATNGTNESEESVPICPVQCAALEPKVIDNSAEGQENMCTGPIDDAESESDNVNGSVENSKSLSSAADNLKTEKDVGDIPIESEDSLPTVPTDCGGTESEVGNGSGEYENSPTRSVEDTKPTAKSGEIFPSCSLDETNALTELGNGPIERGESMSTYSVDNTKSEAEIGNNSTESNNSISTVFVGDAGIESEAINGCVERDSSVPAFPIDDTELKSEVGNSSPVSNKDIPGNDNGKLESVVQNGSAVNSASMPNCANDVINAENVGDRPMSGDADGKAICAEDEYIEGTEKNGIQPLSSDDSTNDALEGLKTNEEVGKRPFRFLIRIPRYVDDKIREEIRLAQLQVDEKTQSRDAIRAAIQSEKATCSEYRDKFEAARSDERAARDLLNAKRQEIDSVQSVINRMKNATSIDEIGDRIHNMEHMIEHETMPLKEEKQLIREIKQLKNLRDQLSSSLGKQAEEQPTLDQRDQIEERFKLLKRELDSTRKEVLRYEGITKVARKIYFDENEKLKELQSQFRAADDLRQEAYVHLQNLRKQLYEKNKYFRMYKEDSKKAEDLAFAGDKEELQRLCVGQVETIMELWNTNDDFRNEYIRCNTMSTLRRLRTLDGRSLGPDEEPPVLRNFLDEKVDNTLAAPPKIGSILPVTTSEQGRSIEPLAPEKAEVKPVVNLEQKNPKADVKSVVNLERNPAAKSKKVSKPAALETGSVTISGREEVEVEEKKQREEEELARKAEELRKEEAAVKLKEQRRLEEKAKAKEAEERKRRNAEKAQAKAELRAKKEAELKEKEREKRARKKERKVAAAALVEGENGGIEGESDPSSENTQPETTTNAQEQPETKDKAGVVTKRRTQKQVVSVAKQTKVKALPPPLRNRGRRRMQPWMWVLLTALIIVALFLVGNIGYSFKFSLPSSFGFF